MFCNFCGSALQPDYRVCPKCGTPVIGPTYSATRSGFANRIRTMGILWIAVSSLLLLPSFTLFTVGHVFPLINTTGPNLPLGNLLVPPFLYGIGTGFLFLSIGGIWVGLGLMRHEPWARTAAIVLAIFSLFHHPPFGTILGIYTLVVLLSRDAAEKYASLPRTP